MKTQITSDIIMVRPDYFGYNPETSLDNHFQLNGGDERIIRSRVLKEFAKAQNKLSEHVNIFTLPSRKDIPTPDAIFPNNWFMTIENDLVLCPMKYQSRRNEIQPKALRNLLNENGFGVHFNSYVHYQFDNIALEGTGSVVFSRDHEVAFAAASERTNEELFNEVCEQYGYKPVYFFSSDEMKMPYYHTNVILSIGKYFVVVCEKAIHYSCRSFVMNELKALGKELLTISQEQVRHYCGNILELKSKKEDSKSIIVMSSNAFQAFHEDELLRLSEFGDIIDIDIPNIEKSGGGSARCLLAEVFLEKKSEMIISDK